MAKRPTLEEFKKKALLDPKFKKEYETPEPEFELLEQFIRARMKAKLSQAQLAKKLKAQQPSIARLERGGYANTSINNLTKVADAMGYSLHISLRAKKKNEFIKILSINSFFFFFYQILSNPHLSFLGLSRESIFSFNNPLNSIILRSFQDKGQEDALAR